MRGTVEDTVVCNSAQLGKNRESGSSYQISKVVVSQARLSPPANRTTRRLRGGDGQTSQINERNGGKSYDPRKSQFNCAGEQTASYI